MFFIGATIGAMILAQLLIYKLADWYSQGILLKAMKAEPQRAWSTHELSKKLVREEKDVQRDLDHLVRTRHVEPKIVPGAGTCYRLTEVGMAYA